MPSKLNTYLLCAVMLAALLQCAPGAPVEDALTDSPAGDTSGEEEERSSDPVISVFEAALEVTKHHQEEFEDEFHVKYTFLDSYKISSLPKTCPKSNFSKEACLHRLAQGLLTYRALLRHVEREYPSSAMLSVVRHCSGLLISLIKGKMRDPEQVTALTSSQEEQLLKAIDSPDTFHRKMTAHSILYGLRIFLIDAKRDITKREKNRANRVTGPVTFYQQKPMREI